MLNLHAYLNIFIDFFTLFLQLIYSFTIFEEYSFAYFSYLVSRLLASVDFFSIFTTSLVFFFHLKLGTHTHTNLVVGRTMEG
jgi:hypothetical protein